MRKVVCFSAQNFSWRCTTWMLNWQSLVLLVAFAADDWHAIVPFERLRIQDQYFPSSPNFLACLLELIHDTLRFNFQNEVPDIKALLDGPLDSLSGPTYQILIAYNKGELLDATTKTVESLVADKSLKSSLLAARSSYNAVSKFYDASAFPGKARTTEQIVQFESNSPECEAELSFQVDLLTALRCVLRLPQTCDEITDIIDEADRKAGRVHFLERCKLPH